MDRRIYFWVALILVVHVIASRYINIKVPSFKQRHSSETKNANYGIDRHVLEPLQNLRAEQEKDAIVSERMDTAQIVAAEDAYLSTEKELRALPIKSQIITVKMKFRPHLARIYIGNDNDPSKINAIMAL